MRRVRRPASRTDSLLHPVECRKKKFQKRSIDISGQLKVLKELTSETKNPDGTHSIILQHILPTTVEYIDRVNSVYPVDLVIAITYSADAGTVALLKAKGYNVLVPPSIDYMLNSLWQDVVALLNSSKHPTVLQEVGGWTAELAKSPSFKGCVEDTKNGLWRYQAASKKAPLAVPVLSMADTALKRVEDSLIGDACVYSLEKVMRSQLASIIDGVRCRPHSALGYRTPEAFRNAGAPSLRNLQMPQILAPVKATLRAPTAALTAAPVCLPDPISEAKEQTKQLNHRADVV